MTTVMPEGFFLFTSESVNEGHPDKLADQVSDAILDACLAQDPESKVACETATKTNMVMVFGEITTTAKVRLYIYRLYIITITAILRDIIRAALELPFTFTLLTSARPTPPLH